MHFRFQGWTQGSGLRVQGSRFWLQGAGFSVQGLDVRVWASGCGGVPRVQSLNAEEENHARGVVCNQQRIYVEFEVSNVGFKGIKAPVNPTFFIHPFNTSNVDVTSPLACRVLKGETCSFIFWQRILLHKCLILLARHICAVILIA